MIDAPLPTRVPAQTPVYHFQLAPVPREPPTTLRVVDPPTQKLLLLVVADVGSVEAVFTVTVMLAQAVVLQSPSALT